MGLSSCLIATRTIWPAKSRRALIEWRSLRPRRFRNFGSSLPSAFYRRTSRCRQYALMKAAGVMKFGAAWPGANATHRQNNQKSPEHLDYASDTAARGAKNYPGRQHANGVVSSSVLPSGFRKILRRRPHQREDRWSPAASLIVAPDDVVARTVCGAQRQPRSRTSPPATAPASQRSRR